MGEKGIGPDAYAREVIEEVAKKVGPDAVFGDPITHGQIALIPVATVSYGGGGGSGAGGGMTEDDPGGEGGGFGFGVSARPVGTIEVGPTTVAYQPIMDYTQLAKIWSWITGAALLMFVARMLFSRR